MFEKPVRKIGPNNRSVTGKRVSRKSPDSQHFESSLERDYFLLLEHDPDVLRVTPQPVTITYYIGKQRRSYTPDAAVYFKSHLYYKPLLVEVKYQAELVARQAELEPKFNAARDYCSHCGYEFTIVTEVDIRSERLDNIRFLSRYKGQKQDLALNQFVQCSFADQRYLTPKQLLANTPEDTTGRLLYSLWQMVADGALLFDMNRRITMETLLWKK